MPDGNRQLRDSGKTVIDVLVGCAVLTLLACLVLPALSKERDDARIAKCADHLKQLGQAAHQYAADFEGKFFYHWTNEVGPDGKLLPSEMIGSWHDQKRVGRYIEGQPMTLRFAASPSRQEKIVDLGLGWGPFRCPSDLEDGARSYGMNYWAVTSLDPGGAERRFKDIVVAAEAQHGVRYGVGDLVVGSRIDMASEHADRLLLFSEAFETIRTSDEWWVTGGTIGLPAALPGERFGGRRDGSLGAVAGTLSLARYNAFQLPTDIDYVRHGGNRNRNLPVGAINITFVDGHVSLMQSDDLYDRSTHKSTYKVLWTADDMRVEANDIE